MSSVAEIAPEPAWRHLPPALASLAVHLIAWILPLLLFTAGWPSAMPLLIQGASALFLSRAYGLPVWWQGINALFFPLAWLVTQAEIEPVWFLAGFFLLALTSWGSLKTRVPLYLSSQQAVEQVAARAAQGARVIDLGCGLGGWLSGLHASRPDLHLAAVEMAPLNWLIARLRLGRLGPVRLGSIWDEDLSRYDIVYAYLSPAPMSRLWDKVVKEMRPGSLFISNTFAVPACAPDEMVELHDLSQARLLIWQR